MISIALATYNGINFITEQLDSILVQTISDYELIICDDHSTDGTWDIIKDYSARDHRIRCYRNIENLGFKANFEKAISLCSNDYVALCDQDDIWTMDHLEHLSNIIEDKAIACGNAALIDRSGDDLGIKLSELERLEFCPEDDLKKSYRILYFGNPFQGASMLIRKDFFAKSLPLPSGINFHDAWFSCFACFFGGINYSDKVITLYRQHGENASTHRKWSLIFSILSVKSLSKLMPDRLCMVKEIKRRIGNLSEEAHAILIDAINFHKRKRFWRYRPFNIRFIIKHYSDIYTTHSKKLFLVRILKSLF